MTSRTPLGIYGGATPLAQLPDAGGYGSGTIGFTSDNGIVQSNGSAWIPAIPTYIIATADQTLTSQASPQNDTVFFASLLAGASYLIEVYVIFICVTTNTQGYLFRFNYSGSLSGNAVSNGIYSSNQAAAVGQFAANTNYPVGTGSTIYDAVRLAMPIVTTTAGTFNFQWCQASSSANATVRKANSLMIVTRVA